MGTPRKVPLICQTGPAVQNKKEDLVRTHSAVVPCFGIIGVNGKDNGNYHLGFRLHTGIFGFGVSVQGLYWDDGKMETAIWGLR